MRVERPSHRRERRTRERIDRAVEVRVQGILDHLPIAFYLRGLDERYELVNSTFVRELGLPAEQILGRTAGELHPGELVEWAREMERPVRESSESVISESAAPSADGTEHYHWILKYPVTDENGNLIGIGGAAIDITERRRAELALAEAEAEQAALNRVATAVAQDAGSRAVFDLIAKELALLLGLDLGIVARFENADEATVMGSWFSDPAMTIPPILKLDGTNVSTMVARTGRAAHIDRYATPTVLGENAHAGVAAPISVAGKLWGNVGAARTGDGGLPANAEERAARFAHLAAIAISNTEAREMLGRLASTDELTGLSNYRSFHERLHAEVERATRHGRQLSLVLIDIDGFKAINDAHGHPRGDVVLAEIARRLLGEMRNTDMVARVGGEEFTLLLPETSAASAFAVAERARHAVGRRPFDIVGKVTVSAGVSSLSDGGDAESMLRLADAALYRAKHAGRDTTLRHKADGKPGGRPAGPAQPVTSRPR